MIGVVTSDSDREIAAEFFELFKIPWEPARAGRRYRAVICTDGTTPTPDADVTIAYGTSRCEADDATGFACEPARDVVARCLSGASLPLYSGALTFAGAGDGTLFCDGKAVAYRHDRGGPRLWRVGYDLFSEVRHLLTCGQPVEYAAVPTLDRHVEQLRHMLVSSGVPLVEVRAAPLGHPFVACLTHDVDFFGIRRHGLDATVAGFLARATVGTAVDLVRMRRSPGQAIRNLAAACSLPLVLLGLKLDFWDPVTQYLAADGGRPSTFFVVPTRDTPGVALDGRPNDGRAVRYEAGDVAPRLREAAAAGQEVALHGIDAWHDVHVARAERSKVARASGAVSGGVRMHWLYFDPDSPRRLDAAGFDYDSTCGYNEDVGFRAGTAQAFRSPGCERLLELPLSIMDTALFFPGRLGLSADEGLARCEPLIDHAAQSGGAIVVNWHDRSLAPERLWNAPYRRLIAELDSRGAWYATAGDAVAWFRWRRSVRFVTDGAATTVRADDTVPQLPGATVRVHHGAAFTDHRLLPGESLQLSA